jgi:PAS domain S-box-containing protein
MIAIRVLLVQNDEQDVSLIRSFCAETVPHISITWVASKDECWSQLAAESTMPFDVLVVEDVLPDSDGMTLLHEIVEAGYPAPVIIITNRTDVETAVTAMKEGASDYLVKSRTYWNHLPRAIDSAIDRYRLVRENKRLHGNLALYASRLEESVHQANLEKARLKGVLDQLPEGVLIVEGADGRTVAANKAAERLWGQAFVADVCLREYNSRFALANLDGSSRKADSTPLARVLKSGEPVMGDQSIIIQPDGQQITILTNAAPLLDPSGRLIGAVAVFQDITEIKQLERLKDEILSIASHELKNPLTVIKGYSSLLCRSPVVAEDVRTQRIAQTVQQQSERMHRLVERLLDLSRLDLGTVNLRVSSFDLVQLLSTVVEQQQQTTQEHILRYRFDDSSLVVMGDYMRLEQVLVNLISNAIKYSPESNDILISLHLCDEVRLDGSICGTAMPTCSPLALVQVQDYGIGIEPEMQHKLFNRFYRAREAAKLAAGQGLGLYIGAEIARMHGGTLCVQSMPGEGTTFSLVLPMDGGSIEWARGIGARL